MRLMMINWLPTYLTGTEWQREDINEQKGKQIKQKKDEEERRQEKEMYVFSTD
jgi:hypothetical protein